MYVQMLKHTNTRLLSHRVINWCSRQPWTRNTYTLRKIKEETQQYKWLLLIQAALRHGLFAAWYSPELVGEG